jgi:hypothetical protein
MFTYKVIELLDSVTEEVNDMVYYADPSRQMLDTRGVHIRLKKVQKELKLIALDILVNGDKVLVDDIEKSLKKQNKRCQKIKREKE